MNNPSFGGTLTGGIQDISALLPLLGTEQCENHVASALTKGYLYAVATPISIFGSLGMARAGFKTLVAGISSQRFIGARTLTNMGFKPQGINLSLIMHDQGADSQYLVESRLNTMLKDLHIDDVRKVKPSIECTKWNIRMFLVTALCCLLSIVPYINLNLRPNKTGTVSPLLFPVIKAIGGFLVATMIQLIIQNRILVIVTQSLTIKAIDADLRELGMSLPKERKVPSLESGIQDLDRHIEQHRNRYPEHIPDANNTKSTNPFQWCTPVNWRNRRERRIIRSEIEKGLRESMYSLRIGSPKSADLNTISIDQYKRLTELKDSLANAQKVGLSHFKTSVYSTLLLGGILASVTGYIGCFSVVQGSISPKGPVIWLVLETTLSIIRFVLWGWNPDGDDLPPFTLNFELDCLFLSTCNKFAEDIDEDKILPLVRAQEFLESVTAYAGRVERFEDSNLALYYSITRKRDHPNDSVLYIAIFDFVERTMRIYVQPTKNEDAFYSAAEGLDVDLERGIVQIKIGNKIDPANDPVAGNANIRTSLAKHYRSVLDEVDSENNSRWTPRHRVADVIRNAWTFRSEDLEPKITQFSGFKIEDSYWTRQHYLNYVELDRQNRTLRKKRIMQNDAYMELIIEKKIDTVELAWRRKEKEAWKTKKVEEGDPTKRRTMENGQKDGQLGGESQKLQETTELDEPNRIGLHKTQIDTVGTEDSDPLGNAKNGAREVKELLIVAERWMMEVVLFHEICGWEKQLREYYKIMTALIVDKMDKPTGERLKKMLTGRWSSNAWIRLSEHKRAMETRWEDELARNLLDQSVKSEYAGSLTDRTGQWNLALDLYVKQSDKPMTFWNLRTVLDDFLRQSDIKDKAQKCGGKWMEKVVQDWCEGMKYRLRCEIEEMEARLDRGEFIISSLYPEQVNGCSKWLGTSGVYSAGHFSFILKNIKHRRRDILLIQFGWGSDDELAELIPTIHNVTSVTTVSLEYCKEFGDKACAALVDVISKNRSIVSVIGKEVTAEIKDGLQRNIDLLGTRTAVSFESGFIYYYFKCLAVEIDSSEAHNCFTLRFLAPTKGNLILWLSHRCYHDMTLQIKEVDSFRHRVPKGKGAEDITLLSTIHFTPGQKTKLTFVIVCNDEDDFYNLYDIQVLDEGGNPYNAM